MSEDRKKLLDHLSQLSTEKTNPNSVNLDRLSAIEICGIINREDKTVAETLQWVIADIARAAEKATTVLKNGGRLFYIGAGTSGRLGVLDAAECPPTFGTNPDQLELLGKVEDACYENLPTLDRDTTYWWRVDTLKSNGSASPAQPRSPRCKPAKMRFESPSCSARGEAAGQRCYSALPAGRFLHKAVNVLRYARKYAHGHHCD